jgi:acyl phosphate:glycerol-3-phosphate acyltransferase
MQFDFINYLTVAFVVLAYLIGSIPTAVWVGKWFYGVDVRDYGSGNAGATNTIRVLGPKAGIPVFIIDVMKGFGAASLAYFCKKDFGDHNEFYALFKFILAFFAIIGHVLPVFAGFKGGKGISTSLGVVFALLPGAALVSFVLFMIVLLISHYVSVGSMSAAIIFPFVSYFVFDCNEWAYIVFSITVVIFIFFTHRKNIRRLRKGEETKFFFKKKIPLAGK